MKRSKKLIIGVVLAVVLLAGSIGGVALANGDEDDNGITTRFGDFIGRVCEIYERETGAAIEQSKLEKAFTEARSEMVPEDRPDRGEIDPEAMKEHLQDLVEQDKISQEQADKMLERWESMANGEGGFGFRIRGGFHGMGGPHGWFGSCVPPNN